MSRRWLSVILSVLLCVPLALTAPNVASAAPTHQADRGSLAHSPELSTTSRLADRRSFVIGDRF